MRALFPRRPRPTVCAAALLALIAATPARAATDDAAEPLRPKPLRNAIVISIDSLRADHLALYGYPRVTTPNLDRLAGERGAFLFTRDTTAAPSCHPSHATILTGLYPQMIGVPWCGEDLVVASNDLGEPGSLEALEGYQADLAAQPKPLVRKRVSAVINWLHLPEATPTLATWLHDRGFATGGFVSIWTVAGRFGYRRGFDRFVDEMPEYYGPRSLSWLLKDTFHSQRRQVGAATMNQVLGFLRGVPKEERFFVFINLADTHVPYDGRTSPPFRDTPETHRALEADWQSRYPPGRWQEAEREMRTPQGFLLDRYDRAIRYTDAQIARLFAELEREGRLDDTLVVVTSDHGDSFGQHLYLSQARKDRLFFEHSVYVWEETQHVPLLVYDPAAGGRLVRRRANVSPVDIVPTVLTRLGFDPAELAAGPLPGDDLTALPEADRTVFFLTFGRGRPGLLQDFHLDFPKFTGLRTGDLKFFVDRDRFKSPDRGRCFLYELATDPHEMRNLCDSPEGERRGQALRDHLVRWYERSVAPRRPAPTTAPPHGGKNRPGRGVSGP